LGGSAHSEARNSARQDLPPPPQPDRDRRRKILPGARRIRLNWENVSRALSVPHRALTGESIVAQSERHLLPRMLRFRLRSLLIAVAVLAAICGLSYRKLHERAVVEQLTDLGCSILYDYELDAEGRYKLPEDRIPPGPSWLRTILGDDLWASPHEALFGIDADANAEQAVQLLRQLPTIKAVWYLGQSNEVLKHVQTALPGVAVEWGESG